MDLFHRITKWSRPGAHPRSWSPSYLAKAFRVALRRAAGPGVPRARLGRAVQRRRRVGAPDRPERTGPRPHRRRDPMAVDEAMALLAAAERPAMHRRLERLVGRRPGRAGRASPSARSIPVYLNGAGRGCLPAGPPDVLPAHPQGGAQRGRPGLRGGHPVRLPPQLRRRADLQRRLEDRPGRHRRHRDRAQPAGGRGHRRRQRARRSRPRRRRPGRPPGPRTSQELRPREAEARGAGRHGRGATPSPSTTTGWRRRSRSVGQRRRPRPHLRRRRRQLGGDGGEGS